MSDDKRLGRLFHDSGGEMRRRIRRFLGTAADAEDVVQDAFLKACEHADTVRVPGAFVYSVAVNLALDRRRRERNAARAQLGDLALPTVDSIVESAESQYLAEERTRLLTQAIETLPPKCRAVLVMRAFHGLSYKEIAEHLGISTKTVENHVAKGIRDVHRQLRGRYES